MRTKMMSSLIYEWNLTTTGGFKGPLTPPNYLDPLCICAPKHGGGNLTHRVDYIAEQINNLSVTISNVAPLQH